MVESVYETRFSLELAKYATKSRRRKGAQKTLKTLQTLRSNFPAFAFEVFKQQYGVENIILQTAYDFCFNVIQHRKGVLEVETFARFLDGSYSEEDLIFFLYSRSVAFREMHLISSGDRISSSAVTGADWKLFNPLQPYHLEVRRCTRISRSIFGDEMESMHRAFLHVLRPYFQEHRRIELSRFLSFALHFHSTIRPNLHGQRGSILGSADTPGEKPPSRGIVADEGLVEDKTMAQKDGYSPQRVGNDDDESDAENDAENDDGNSLDGDGGDAVGSLSTAQELIRRLQKLEQVAHLVKREREEQQKSHQKTQYKEGEVHELLEEIGEEPESEER
jgi:hypothetical protein